MIAPEPSGLAIILFPVLMTGLLLALRIMENRTGEFQDGTYRYLLVWVKKEERPVRWKIHRAVFDLLILAFGLMSLILIAQYVGIIR